MDARDQGEKAEEVSETTDNFHSQGVSPSKLWSGPTNQPDLRSLVHNPQEQTMSAPNSGQQRQAEYYFTPIQHWLQDAGRVSQNESHPPPTAFSPNPGNQGPGRSMNAPYHPPSIGSVPSGVIQGQQNPQQGDQTSFRYPYPYSATT